MALIECIGKLNWGLETIADMKKKQGDINWPLNYAALLNYSKEHGTCNVPQDDSYECDLKGLGEDGGVYRYVGNLGQWLGTQRQAKKGKGTYKLTPERQALLQKLVDEGKCTFVCFISTGMVSVLAYHSKDHLCFVIINILCMTLYDWIGKLNWEFEGLSARSKTQGDIDWPRNYAALLEYYKEHGACNVPQRDNYECDLEGLGEDWGVYHYVGNLGNWLATQRQAKKGKGTYKLTPERQALLQKLVDEGKCKCISFKLF